MDNDLPRDKILVFIKDNPGKKTVEIAEALNLNFYQATNTLQRLIKNDRIYIKKDGNKNMYYVTVFK